MIAKYFGKSWYLGVFIAVMGFAAGTALDGDYRYVAEALSAAGELEGAALMALALQSVLLDMMLYLWASLSREAALARLLALPGIWFKMMIMGLCCRGLFYGGVSFRGLILCLFTVIGGSTVCASLTLRPEERSTDRDAKRMRLYLWTAGVLAEGVLIPSVAKSLALLFD